MSKRLTLTHHINFILERPVRFSTHWLRLHPAPHNEVQIDAYSLHITTHPHFINWVHDPFGNRLARLDFPEPVRHLGMVMEALLTVHPASCPSIHESSAASWPFSYPDDLVKELSPYLAQIQAGPCLTQWFQGLQALTESESNTRDILASFGERCRHLSVKTAEDPLSLDLEALLAKEKGSFWTLAWLATLSLRHLGLAARFVSGYRLVGKGDFHAWSEIYLPWTGWIGLDPVTGTLTDGHYLPLARVPEPLAALPLVGYHEACPGRWDESVSLKPLTQTATGHRQADVDALGRHVWERLDAEDMRLSVGRSLDFTAVDGHHLSEWRFGTDGEDKRCRGERLLARLWTRLAQGGALHSGQGEWYAGESAPRWQMSLYYRQDGRPLWRNPALLDSALETPAMPDILVRVREALAKALGIASCFWQPAYEDPLASPASPAPLSADLVTPQQRLALAEQLSADCGEPRGWVLPLRWDPVISRWNSGRWHLRRSRLFLIPGDFPLGYRLPLNSLPCREESALDPERDPFEPYSPLPDFHDLICARTQQANEVVLDSDPPRTALCLEIRGGRLHVFVPPLTHLEAYLELLAAVELAIEGDSPKVILEGHQAPPDPRLKRFTLTPEAGILKLALPQAEGWEEHGRLINLVYDEAAALGLTAERQAGKVNHPAGNGPLILGGRCPGDSPFLRRPGILRSLITYWQHHPALSYFFAGSWVGADGPAPRPDEGGIDALYELSLALERLGNEDCALPWLTDRLLRHLVTGPDGDPQRSEIRIDRLYSPNRASERRGLVILNAFATPFQAEAAQLQMLLTGALMARFAVAPYHLPLRRWGPDLYDRFLLPAVLWENLKMVCDDLKSHDFPIQLDWFTSFLDRRFPVLIHLQWGSLVLELRPALEPWPLLAETGGNVRFLDNANERVQVTVEGFVPERHQLLCNGQIVPLAPCGKGYVASIRYKATTPPATLNPVLAPIRALNFDLVDRWRGLVIGGVSYQPAHWESAPLPPSPLPIVAMAEGISPIRPQPSTATPTIQGRPRFRRYGGRPLAMMPVKSAVARPFFLDLTRQRLEQEESA